MGCEVRRRIAEGARRARARAQSWLNPPPNVDEQAIAQELARRVDAINQHEREEKGTRNDRA